MSDVSRYVRYLPPALWDQPPDPSDVSLGAWLRIFEKILSGIDDGVAADVGPAHEAIETTIAGIHRLFNPWTTKPELVEWLASWVALDLSDQWDDYQRRKITAEIVGVYKRGGRKEGLDQYLDLYTVAEKRPRIAIDHASKLLYLRPHPVRRVPVHTLVSQGPSIEKRELRHDGLVHPTCLALAPDGSLLVGDMGTPTGFAPQIKSGVWRVQQTGAPDFAGTPAQPRRIGPDAFKPSQPVSIVVDRGTPWIVYVLDAVPALPDPSGVDVLFALTSPSFDTVRTVAKVGQLGVANPVAMALDRNGHLLILDRGRFPQLGAAIPALIDVQIAPFAVTSRRLTTVIEPLSLLVLPNGDVLIGDGGKQTSAVAANIVKLDRAANRETMLLADGNTLVAPVALARMDDGRVLVLDRGLKPHLPRMDSSISAPYRRHIAEPAAVYALGPSADGATVVRVSETRGLVHPTGMVAAGDTVYIADRGEYADPGTSGPMMRVWRASAGEFGVVVHFSEQRPTTPRERRQIVQDIFEIVSREKPAHSDFTMVYSV